MNGVSPQRSDNAPAMNGRVRKLSADDVRALIDAPKTPRVRELETYQAVFEGTAYNGRPSFFTDDKPMQERKPCVIYPIARIAAESNVAFAMGEGRFPTVLSQSSEDDKSFDDDLGVSMGESTVLDAFNAKLIKLARLERVFRQAYRMAQASRSVAIVVGFRAGKPFADLVWSKLCKPYFDDPLDPQKCTKLEIRYRYTEMWRDPVLTGGEWWTRVFEYLRVIDNTYDTVYQPVQIWDVTDAGAIDRKSPTKSVTKHDFGFCPVHWYARNLESVIGVNIDGQAIHDGACELIEQLDFALSQRHRAAIYAGDPQTVITGVTDDDNIGATGRTKDPNASVLANEGGKAYASGFLAPFKGMTGGALKRGVMHPWVIKDATGKAVVLALPGDALDALDKDASDIGSKVCDALGVTIVDPSMFGGGGDLSGRTLAFIFSKQINRVSQDREDLGRCCILPVLNLFYRMLLKMGAGVYLPGLAKVAPIFKRFYKDVSAQDADGKAITVSVWFAPQLELKWGDYFEPSDVDESTRVQTAINAYTAKIITLKSAIEHCRGVFVIANVDQYADTLAKEVAQRQQDAVDNATAMTAAAGNPKAQQSPNAAPPANGAPKASRKQAIKTKKAA